MQIFSKYWKALLALLLAGAAAFLFFDVYKTEKAAYESEKQMLTTTIMALQKNIADNRPYEAVQDEINAEKEKLTASRLDLYNHLPVDVKQEDQIMYVLYLESVFGAEINFEFASATPVLELEDRSLLKAVDLIVNYRSSYEGFQEMIDYLAQDSRVVSIDKANIKYYPLQDLAIGFVKVRMYLLDTTNSSIEAIRTLRQYTKPEILNKPETSKENIFDNKYHQPSKEVPTQKPGPSRDDLKPGGGSDLDSKMWVTAFNARYHLNEVCAYNTQYYYNRGVPVQMTLAEIAMNNIQPCEACYGIAIPIG